MGLLILKALGSLSFALFLIGTLGVILIVSTLLESLYGTPFAQRFFYQAGWFDVFLAFIAVNITCSALTRLPFKKKHTGFVITHIGILLILCGSLLSRLFGVDGQMALYENESSDRIVETRPELVITAPGHETAVFDVAHTGLRRRPLAVMADGSELALEQVWLDAVTAEEIEEGPAGAPANPAIRLELQSDLAGFKNSLWLVKNHPDNPGASSLALGPAVLELKEKTPKPEKSASDKPELRIYKKGSQEALTVDLTNIPKGDLTIPGTDFRVVGLHYFPDARVDGSELVSVSDAPNNPAALFNVYDAKGRHKKFAKFALFPEFESMHGKTGDDGFNLETDFQVPEAPSPLRAPAPKLTIYHSPAGWSYESVSSKNSAQGEIKNDKTYSAGWMDFSFRVEKLLERAVVRKEVVRAGANEQGGLAAEVSVRKDKETARYWVTAGSPLTLPVPGGRLVLTVRQKELPAPFRLKLKDFRKVDYPGTSRPASFESDVSLRDDKDNITLEKTISMNKPLDYKGFRIFQSSYIQDPVHGEASVFTVAKNPGIGLIYGGSVILFLGVFLVFFVPPFSSLKYPK